MNYHTLLFYTLSVTAWVGPDRPVDLSVANWVVVNSVRGKKMFKKLIDNLARTFSGKNY